MLVRTRLPELACARYALRRVLFVCQLYDGRVASVTCSVRCQRRRQLHSRCDARSDAVRVPMARVVPAGQPPRHLPCQCVLCCSSVYDTVN